MEAEQLPTDSILATGAGDTIQVWHKTAGNPWRNKVWSAGDTDVTDREMDEILAGVA